MSRDDDDDLDDESEIDALDEEWMEETAYMSGSSGRRWPWLLVPAVVLVAVLMRKRG